MYGLLISGVSTGPVLPPREAPRPRFPPRYPGFPPRATARAEQANVSRVKASPDAQLRLLELAEIDAELTRLEHRRRSLPEHEELTALGQRDRGLGDELAPL